MGPCGPLIVEMAPISLAHVPQSAASGHCLRPPQLRRLPAATPAFVRSMLGLLAKGGAIGHRTCTRHDDRTLAGQRFAESCTIRMCTGTYSSWHSPR